MTLDDIHHTLAGHLLYGLNLAYEEVDEVTMRAVREVGEDPSWEVEVCCHGIGVSIALRGTCPLTVALAVAERIVPMLERYMGDEAVN